MAADAAALARIASGLAWRVREYDPQDNAAWLAEQLPDPGDWFRLAFALAAAVPDDRSWAQLTAWVNPKPAPRQERPPKPPAAPRRVAKCGTPSGARKHWIRGESACQACRDVEAERARARRAAQKTLETAA